MNAWTPQRIPDLSGKTIIVTGANSGIGYDAALQLADKGAQVVLACRNQEKGTAAVAQIQREVPNASLELMPLDLANLASVRDFAERFAQAHARLDILINNAGVMALPKRATHDGFEMQFGTNHLGHFALTGLLLERLLGTPRSRVVTVSSIAHRAGSIRFHDLQWEKSYGKWGAYGQSKLANLLFMNELDRRLKAAGKSTVSVACHPGFAATNLQAAGPQMSGSVWSERVITAAAKVFAQGSAAGALPTLYAAVEPLDGGEYVGPGGLMEMTGPPKLVSSSAKAKNPELAARLWEVSEELTGVQYTFSETTTAFNTHYMTN